MDRIRVHTIFVAVFDKSSLDKLAPLLSSLRIKALGTEGTVKYLLSKGVDAQNVLGGFDYDGRVKSLDRKNFVAILADKNKPTHMKALDEEEVLPIDAVIVDLYAPDESNFPETMDIGGQALIRAAIKNYENVAVAYDTHSIHKLTTELDEHNGETPLSFRKNAARDAAKFIAERTELEATYFDKI